MQILNVKAFISFSWVYSFLLKRKLPFPFPWEEGGKPAQLPVFPEHPLGQSGGPESTLGPPSAVPSTAIFASVPPSTCLLIIKILNLSLVCLPGERAPAILGGWSVAQLWGWGAGQGSPCRCSPAPCGLGAVLAGGVGGFVIVLLGGRFISTLPCEVSCRFTRL